MTALGQTTGTLRHFLLGNRNWLAAGALLTLLSSFGQTFFISIFAAKIQADFDLTHGSWGAMYALGTSVSAVVMLWAGGLTDHFRARTLGMVVLVMLAVACLLMALNPYAVLLPLVIFALRLTGQGMTSHIAIVAMARWFVATRGRALSIATLGFSFGEAVLPIIFVALMTLFDWRVLWGLAAAIALLGVPILARLLHEERTPQSMATENQSVGMDGRHWTRTQSLGHPLFWFMVPALLGLSAFGTAFFFQQAHYAAVNGWTHLSLVALFPIYTGVGIVAMVVSGFALDRFGTARLIPFYQLPLVAGFLCFAAADRLAIVALGLVFFAMTTGANSTLPNAFWAEFYGTRHIGSIKAMAAAVMVLGSAIGPLITGILIDWAVPLGTQYVWVAAYFAMTTAAMWFGVARARLRLTVAA
ncbi:MFS transporter [uncultured Tateyamaria sp.]|uniref:MFS transporter n=1 Tax=uncultured Tateyamaria sp. TaxID=455651 RepID=UPI00263034D1|nr:MFS transporter [uncultured Tateyamaria sp.]